MMIDAPFQEWMHTHGGAGNTCPMCRVYITRVGNLNLCGINASMNYHQEDEFPDLGHNPHRRH